MVLRFAFVTTPTRQQLIASSRDLRKVSRSQDRTCTLVVPARPDCSSEITQTADKDNNDRVCNMWSVHTACNYSITALTSNTAGCKFTHSCCNTSRNTAVSLVKSSLSKGLSPPGCEVVSACVRGVTVPWCQGSRCLSISVLQYTVTSPHPTTRNNGIIDFTFVQVTFKIIKLSCDIPCISEAQQ